MRDRPDGLREADLRLVLAEGWRIEVAALRYAAVGGGSYHWVARDGAGQGWFVTADDLDDKAWLGHTRPEVMAGLRSALATVLALRGDAGLDFVVAPVAGRDAELVRPAGPRYAVAVYPLLDGSPGRWGEPLPAPQRAMLTGMLAALHESAPPAPARVAAIGLARRADLETALEDLDRPWPTGPFGERARTLLAGASGRIRDALRIFDRLSDTARASRIVVTHGEPHPGNVIRAGPRLLLIDWDTVALAPPERDLWMMAGEARRYAGLTGRDVDPELVSFYRLRWALDDICAFVYELRRPHGRTADAEHAWRSLDETMVQLLTILLDIFRIG